MGLGDFGEVGVEGLFSVGDEVVVLFVGGLEGVLGVGGFVVCGGEEVECGYVESCCFL